MTKSYKMRGKPYKRKNRGSHEPSRWERGQVPELRPGNPVLYPFQLLPVHGVDTPRHSEAPVRDSLGAAYAGTAGVPADGQQERRLRTWLTDPVQSSLEEAARWYSE